MIIIIIIVIQTLNSKGGFFLVAWSLLYVNCFDRNGYIANPRETRCCTRHVKT